MKTVLIVASLFAGIWLYAVPANAEQLVRPPNKEECLKTEGWKWVGNTCRRKMMKYLADQREESRKAREEKAAKK